MSIRKRAFAGGAFAAAVALSATTAGAATIVNGSFETSSLTTPLQADLNILGFVPLSAGGAFLPGWTISGASVDFVGKFWKAANGSDSVELSAFSNGALSQTIATVIGQTYEVTFDMAGNITGPPTAKRLMVDVNGLPNLGQIYSFDTTGETRDDMGWQSESYTFTANSSLSTLSFSSDDPPNGHPSGTPWGAALDNVSIETLSAVPEPATWAMMILGIGMIGWGLRIRASAVAVRRVA